MTFEIESEITGKLVKNSVKITSKSIQNELLSKGYGEKFDGDFILNSFEILYLTYIKKLKISKMNKNIPFDELMNIYKKNEDDIFTKFLVYRDLRTRGYVTKKGFGFGSDFRVYEKGTYGKKDAKFVIFAFNEGTQQKIGKLYKNIHEITQMGKEPIIAVIERRGEIIYYKINKMNFLENQPNFEMKDFNFN